MNIEICSCSGGMAEGFRRAGIRFDLVIDKDPDAVESYERNHGRRPVQMDVFDFLRMLHDGWRPSAPVDLFLADPPCTPWSRAGKRLGREDVRDCLEATADLIRLLRPRAYLIGNVPGLQDSTNWHVVQDVIGGLRADGYCVADYASLDAADYGVPQFRVRPFWFGHLDGPCLSWPAPTHGAPTTQLAIGGHALAPWLTCRQALHHLPIGELGRPVRMKIRAKGEDNRKNGGDLSRWSEPDRPAKTVVAKADRKGGQILIPVDGHPTAKMDSPAPTVRAGGAGHSAPHVVLETKELLANDKHPCCTLDEPAKTVTSHLGATGAVQGGSALFVGEAVEHQHHRISNYDQPSYVIKTGGGRASGNGSTMRLPELLEPRSDCHPISEPDEPSKAIVSSMPGNGGAVMRLPDPNRPPAKPDEPIRTVTRQNEFQGLLQWPWDRPSTTILGDERLSVPGHHDATVGNSSHKGQNAIVLSARAAAILQGFPDGECTGHDAEEFAETREALVKGSPSVDTTLPGEACRFCGLVRRWHFTGATKKAVWSQLGQAMPPPLAEAVARSIAEQMRASPAESAA